MKTVFTNANGYKVNLISVKETEMNLEINGRQTMIDARYLQGSTNLHPNAIKALETQKKNSNDYVQIGSSMLMLNDAFTALKIEAEKVVADFNAETDKLAEQGLIRVFGKNSYTEEWTGETKFAKFENENGNRVDESKVEKIGGKYFARVEIETAEVKAIRAKISELKSAVELYEEKEAVREADLARIKVIELQNKINKLKGTK